MFDFQSKFNFKVLVQNFKEEKQQVCIFNMEKFNAPYLENCSLFKFKELKWFFN